MSVKTVKASIKMYFPSGSDFWHIKHI